MTDASATKMELQYSHEQPTHTMKMVSECLTNSHVECSGFYSDQQGEFFVKCGCSCHRK